MSQFLSKDIDFSRLPSKQIVVHVPNDEISLKIYWVKYGEKIIKAFSEILDKIIGSKMYYHLGCLKDKKCIILKLCLACHNADLYIIQKRKGALNPILLYFKFKWKIYLKRRVWVKLLRSSFPIDKQKGKKKENINQASIQYQPDYPTEWYNIGVLLQNEKRFKEAKKAYQEAIKKDPSYALAWNNLGVMMVKQGDNQRAETAYRKAIEFNPTLATAWYNLGNRLVLKNQEKDAEAAYRKAIELQPDYSNAQTQLAQLLQNQSLENESEGISLV